MVNRVRKALFLEGWAWEDSELDRTDYHPTTGIFADMYEVMRLDDPETYEKCMSLEKKR